MSSTIFERNETGAIVPRQDARVRIFLKKKQLRHVQRIAKCILIVGIKKIKCEFLA